MRGVHRKVSSHSPSPSVAAAHTCLVSPSTLSALSALSLVCITTLVTLATLITASLTR